MEEFDFTNMPPENRQISYLPQDLALFPHLDVRGNILFGAKQRKLDPALVATAMPVVNAIWISGCPKRACSSAMRRSQAQPSSAPPPEQSPEMAAMVTTWVFANS